MYKITLKKYLASNKRIIQKINLKFIIMILEYFLHKVLIEKISLHHQIY